MLNLLPDLGLSLALTLALEELFALVWGVRGRRDWLLLLGVNAVTNPVVVTLFSRVSQSWAFVALLELAAAAAEGAAYHRWGKTTRPALLFSLCANCFSFFSGLLLNYFW